MGNRAWIRAGAALAIAALQAVNAGCGSRSNLQADASGSAGSGAGGSAGTTGSAGTGGAATGTTATTTGAAGMAACKPGDGPVLLASDMGGQYALAIDADSVYFAPSTVAGCDSMSAIKRVSKAGGAAETLWKAVWPISAIAVDGERVYWTDDPVSPCTDPADPGYLLHAGPKSGGAPAVFPPAGQMSTTFAMAQDSARVYWVDHDPNTQSVRSAPKDGGPPELVYETTLEPTNLGADETRLYAVSSKGVFSSDKGPSSPELVAKPPLGGGFIGLALDGGAVYFGGWVPCQGADCEITGLIESIPKGQPAAPTQIAAEPSFQPVSLAVDEEHVYWTEIRVGDGKPVPGRVMRARKDGSDKTQLGEGELLVGIAVDDTCVYWANEGDGTIWKAPK